MYLKELCLFSAIFLLGIEFNFLNAASLNVNRLKNAAAVWYHLDRHEINEFDLEVHYTLEDEFPQFKCHKYDKVKGYTAGPDLVVRSKKSNTTRAFEYQFSQSGSVFKISPSRYQNLKKYSTDTGNPSYWVICLGGTPIVGGTVNKEYAPDQCFILPLKEIVPSKSYRLSDLKEFNMLNRIIWSEK